MREAEVRNFSERVFWSSHPSPCVGKQCIGLCVYHFVFPRIMHHPISKSSFLSKYLSKYLSKQKNSFSVQSQKVLFVQNAVFKKSKIMLSSDFYFALCVLRPFYFVINAVFGPGPELPLLLLSISVSSFFSVAAVSLLIKNLVQKKHISPLSRLCRIFKRSSPLFPFFVPSRFQFPP